MNVLVVGSGSFGKLRGAALARRGCAVAFAPRDLERARADFERADAVVVATPPACHTEGVLAAARAGKPVLLEKPVEATLERARALERGLDGRAGLVSVAENYRFLPQLPLVRELLKAVGPVAAAEVVLRRSRAPRGWRIDRALSGGGVLADMGVHYVHLLRLLLGELAVDAAEERARVPGTDCDATFFLAGTSEKGARWSIELSWRSLRRRSSVILRGERGTLRFRVGRLGVWRVGWLGIPLGRRVAPGDDPYGQEALHDDWLRAVARGETGAVSLAEGIRDLAIVDFAYALAGRAERK